VDELGQQGAPEEWPPPPAVDPAWASPTVDVLVGGPGQPGQTLVPPPARRSRRGIVAGVVAVLLVLGGATGYAAWAKLNGGGPQPDEVLPADTFAMVKLDLDPPAGQKVEVYRLLQRFPHLTQVSGSDEDFKAWLLRRLSMAAADAPGVDFDRDIKPWLGDRVAVAAVPDGNSVDGLLVVQVTDEQAATDAMRKFSVLEAAAGTGDYVVHKGFLVVSSGGRGSAAAAVRRADTASLAHDAQYVADVASMHSDQVVTAWVDLAKATDRVQHALAGSGLGPLGGDVTGGMSGLPSQGRAVLGLHVTDGNLELQLRTIGGKPATAEPPVGTPSDLAPGVLGFLSVSGAGDAVATGLGPLASTPAYAGLLAEAKAVGLDLPGDLRTLFGSRLTVSVGAQGGAEPVFLAASRTSDPAAAAAVVRKLLRSAGPDTTAVAMRTTGSALYVGSSQAVVDAAGTGRLPSEALYRRAVVDADRAQTVAFVDLTRVWDVAKAQGADIDEELQQVAAVGLSSTTNGGDSSVTVRVVFR
jgi:hypothetical protein